MFTNIQQYQNLIAGLRSSPPEKKQAATRRLARTDLFYLLWVLLKRKDAGRQWILDRCIEVQNNPDGYLDLWAREHYKSTIITVAKSIQDILITHGEDSEGRETTIGIFSHTRPIAKGFLRFIKREFEQNTVLKWAFPDILYNEPHKESPKWAEDEGIIVKRKSNAPESTVEAWGLVDGQPTGKHFQILVYDDVVTDKSVTTSDMIHKTTSALELSYNLGTDGGRKRFIGTIYDDQDTWSVIRERGTAKPRVYPVTDDGTATGSPVLISERSLREKLRDMGPYVFSCQMLLDPVPDTDSYFSRDMFHVEPEKPDYYNVYGCSDYAVTEDDGDKTEHGIFGLDHLGRPWVFDWWTGQTRSDVWIESQIDMILEHQPHVWVGESGPIRRSIEPFLERRMHERRTYVQLKWLPSIADKPTRCRPFQGLIAFHGLRMIQAPWNNALIHQLMRFPKSKEDDKADTCSLFGRALNETWAAPVPEIPKPRKNVRDYRFKRSEGGTWRTA